MLAKIHRDKLPENAQVSPDAIEKAEYFADVMVFGKHYYVPLTEEIKKIDQVTGLRDIIAAVYYQIRDTVGGEIERSIMGEIKEGLDKYLSEGIADKVRRKMDESEEDHQAIDYKNLIKIKLNRRIIVENLTPAIDDYSVDNIFGYRKLMALDEAERVGYLIVDNVDEQGRMYSKKYNIWFEQNEFQRSNKYE